MSAIAAETPDRTLRATPARVCAFAVLRRVFEQDAWADRALHGEARRLRLDPRERGLAMQLAYGAVQRRATLDALIEALAGRSPRRLDAAVLAGLRLGLFQLLFLDRVPAHAAVGESVELVKRDSPGGAKLVNAVLRRAAREGRGWLAALGEETPEQAALRHSHPEWIARLWWEALGPATARELLAAGNRPAENAIRANTLKIGAAELRERLLVGAAIQDDALVLDGPWDAHASPEYQAGLCMPQSRAAQAVARLLGPCPGERILDLCAAPGGKTTHLAALISNEGAITAVERHAGRADALRRTVTRMGASCVDVRTEDAAAFDEPETYDRVLVDPPCSDLGTLAARPDARWRKDEADPERLAVLQRRILRAGARALKPGGVLVYSTCTISPAENERVIGRFLDEHPGFAADDLRSDAPVWQHPSVPTCLLTLPSRDGTDGFFMARLRRTEAA